MTLKLSRNITVICFVLSVAQMLSLQDVIHQSMFLALLLKVVGW